MRITKASARGDEVRSVTVTHTIYSNQMGLLVVGGWLGGGVGWRGDWALFSSSLNKRGEMDVCCWESEDRTSRNTPRKKTVEAEAGLSFPSRQGVISCPLTRLQPA